MKRYAAALAAVMSIALFAACEKEPAVPVQATAPTTVSQTETTAEATAETMTAAPEPVKAASAADIAAAVTAEIEIPSAVEKNADNIGAFYDVDVSAIEDMAVFVCGSGAYPDELAVFKFKDADAAKANEGYVRKRLEDQDGLYRGYTPEEVYKIDDAVLLTKDEWVILAITENNSRAEEIITDMV